MAELDVRIERLEPMRVASVRAVGRTPEHDAWEKISAWAESRGLLDDPETYPIYGFNNPSPTADCQEYGYEIWIRIDPDTDVEGDVEVKQFSGGRYAVTTHDGVPNPQIWKRLWDWVQSSPYQWRETHELEKVHNLLSAEEDLACDLYLPIED